MAALFYDENYAVELFDRVEIRLDGQVFDGFIKAIHPRVGDVTVRYLDHLDARRDGEPKRNTARVPVADCDLIGRDG